MEVKKENIKKTQKKTKKIFIKLFLNTLEAQTQAKYNSNSVLDRKSNPLITNR